ncbi:hypothetical protein HY994_05165 [Candidatus Micrarchaeota archaeon]|nr:hypothetical protein [Candidatus Micrarchaeota archaeon]
MAHEFRNINEMKQYVSANKAHFTGEHGPGKKEFDQTTMFIPVATEGKAVINVQNRQNFLTTGISNWRLYHFYRAASIMGAVATVWLLFINPLLSAAAGMAAAWSYGEYLKKDFTVNHIYKTRYMLEST